MLAGQAAAEPDAVWDSNRGDAAEARAERKARPAKAAPKPAATSAPKAAKAAPGPRRCRTSSLRSSATSVERPPAGAGWVHEIKFDGYRVQLRIERRGRDAEDPQGAGLDREVRRHRQAAAKSLPDAIIDGEIVALDDNGAPDFAALQAALSEEKTDDLIFFAFDLLFEGETDLRPLPLSERKARLEGLLTRRRAAARPGSSALSSISRRAATRC